MNLTISREHRRVPFPTRFNIHEIDWGLAALAALFLWLCLLLFAPPQIYGDLSYKLGPGSIGVQDVFLFCLGAASLWLVEVRAQVPGPVRTLFRFIAFWSLYCTFLGLLSGAGQPLVTDWKRVEGLFAGLGLAILLQRSKYGPEHLIRLFLLGVIGAGLFASVTGIGPAVGVLPDTEGLERLGGLGINLINGIWPMWLPVLLCSLAFSRQDRDKVLLVLLTLVVMVIVAANGARSTALSVLFSLVASFGWIFLVQLRLKKPSMLAAPRPHREVARNGLALVVLSLGILVLVSVGLTSDRVRPFLGGFVYRLTAGNPADLESIASRALEIKEMLDSMSPAQLLFGKGYGGTYHYSIAELWVQWGLYPSAFLIAPHILIAALMLKGGIVLFLIGGVLLPFWCGRNLLLSLARPWPEYMRRVAPYDLAILASSILLYTSSLYDGTIVLSLSLLLTLRLFRGSLWSPKESEAVSRR